MDVDCRIGSGSPSRKLTQYRIAGNFGGRKFWRIGELSPKLDTPKSFYCTKSWSFAKVLTHQNYPLYGIRKQDNPALEGVVRYF